MKLSSRDQMILAGVLIGLVAVLFVVFLVLPQFSSLKRLDAEMSQAQQDITAAQQLLATRQAAKAKAAETQAKLTRLENEMPDAPELPALIIDLQNTANDAGVEWSTMAPSRPADAGGYQKMPLGFTVFGQWDDVVDYLRRLSELERSVRVLNVTLTPRTAASTSATGTTEPQMINANINVEVYSMPRNATGAGAPGAAPGAPTPTSGQ